MAKKAVVAADDGQPADPAKKDDGQPANPVKKEDEQLADPLKKDDEQLADPVKKQKKSHLGALVYQVGVAFFCSPYASNKCSCNNLPVPSSLPFC